MTVQPISGDDDLRPTPTDAHQTDTAWSVVVCLVFIYSYVLRANQPTAWSYYGTLNTTDGLNRFFPSKSCFSNPQKFFGGLLGTPPTWSNVWKKQTSQTENESRIIFKTV